MNLVLKDRYRNAGKEKLPNKATTGVKLKRREDPYSFGGHAPTITVTFPSSVLLKRRGLVNEDCFEVSADGMVSAPDDGVLAVFPPAYLTVRSVDPLLSESCRRDRINSAYRVTTSPAPTMQILLP